MKILILLILSLLCVSCVHRYEVSSGVESYNEKYTNPNNPPRVGFGTPITSFTPQEDETQFDGLGVYIGGSNMTAQGYTVRMSLGYVQFEEKEYQITRMGYPEERVRLSAHSAALELAAGYHLDAYLFALRPEILVKEQLYYFDHSSGWVTENDLVSHEYWGIALNLEFPFIVGALGVRAAAYSPIVDDNSEIERAYAYSAMLNLIFGSYSKR